MSLVLTDENKTLLRKNNINPNKLKELNNPDIVQLLLKQLKKEEESKANRSLEEMMAESRISERKYKRAPKRKTRKPVKQTPLFSNKKKRIKNLEEQRKERKQKYIQKKRSQTIVDMFDNMKIKGGVCKDCGKVKIH